MRGTRARRGLRVLARAAMGVIAFATAPARGESTGSEATPALKLREVLVTAPHPDPMASPSAALSVIAPSEQRVSPSSVADAVRESLGVFESGQGGLFQTLSVRGVAGQRVGTTLAGMRVVTERRAGASLSFLDPTLIETAEVLRGPIAGQRVPGALGGVIDLAPRHFEDGFFEGGYDFQGNENHQSAGWGGDSWSAAIARRSSDNTQDADDVDLYDHYNQYSAVLSKTFTRGESQLELLAIPSIADDIGKSNSDFPGRTTDYPSERHLFAAVRGHGEWADAMLYVHPNDLKTRVRRPGDVREVDNEAVDYGGWLRLRQQLLEDVTAAGGVELFGRAGVDANEVRHVSGLLTEEFDTLDDGRQQEIGAYGSLMWEPDWLTLQGFVRYTHLWQLMHGSDVSSDGAWTGMAGALVPVGELVAPLAGLELLANAGTSVRFPTLTERFFSGTTGRGSVLGNENLQSERSFEVDAGLRWQGEKLALEAYWFRNRIDDYVEQADLGDGVTTFENRTSATIYGVEAGASYRVADWLRLIAQGQLMHGRDDDGEPIADVSPARMILVAEGRWSHGTLAVGVEQRFGKHDPGPSELTLDAATLVSARAGWDFDSGVSVWVHGTNMADDVHRTAADEKSATATGTSFGFGVRWLR